MKEDEDLFKMTTELKGEIIKHLLIKIQKEEDHVKDQIDNKKDKTEEEQEESIDSIHHQEAMILKTNKILNKWLS